MKFVALTDLPQGQRPGDVFETTEAQGHVLILVGAARPATDEEGEVQTMRPARRRYQRRDLEAES